MSDRNETPVEVQKVVPSWIVKAQEDDTSLDNIKQYKRLPILKIVQGSSDSDLKKQFGEGSCITSPGKQLVAESEQPFLFVPCFAFTEFCKWSDIKDKESPMIMERSFSPASEIAIKSRDMDQRIEEYGTGNFKSRYVEHINFPGVIYNEGHPLQNSEVVISFSRGEFFTGTGFCTAIQMRKMSGIPVPLYGQIWEFKTGEHKGGGYSWFGFNFNNPPENPYIQEEEAEKFKEAHDNLKKDFQDKIIIVEHDDPEAEEDKNAEL